MIKYFYIFSFKIIIFIYAFIFLICEGVECGEIVFYENKEYYDIPVGRGFKNVSQFRSIIDLCGEWEYKKESQTTWEKVFIPCCYEYDGKLLFRKKFKIDSTYVNKHLKLFLYGVNYKCIIKINDRLLGSHFGGYSSFSLEIPDNILIRGENKIDIEVDSKLDIKETIPIKQQIYGWKNYGGIFREIFILATPKISIDEVDIKYDFFDGLKSCSTYVNFQIRNFSTLYSIGEKKDAQLLENIVEVGYGVELYDSDKNELILRVDSGSKFFKIHKLGNASISFFIKNFQLWNINNPKLYELRIFIMTSKQRIDEEKILIGYKDLKIKDGDIFINNEKTKLWGILYNEDYPGLGSALNWKVIEEDIVKMKNLGFNLIQSGYYPAHPYFYELCDRYGIFTIESFPIWNVPTVCFKNKKFIELGINYLKEIIQRDKNHSSIIAWGLGGELESSDTNALNFINGLIDVIKNNDYRPSFFSSRIIKNEKCANVVDLPGFNTYSISPDEMEKQLYQWKSKFPQKPLIVSRYGVDLFSFEMNKITGTELLDYQAVTLENFYKKIASNDDIDISILWSYSDWKLEKPLLIIPPKFDRYIYQIGLTDYQRNERISYRVIKALNTQGKLPSIFTVDHKDYEPYEYQVVGFIMIITLIFFSKKNKKFSQNFKRSLFFPKGYFRDVIQNRVLSIQQTFLIGIMISITFSMILSSYFYYFKFNKDFDYFISHFIFINIIKEIIGKLAWNPIYFMLYISLILLVCFIIASWLLYIWGIFQRVRLNYNNILHIVFWSGVNNLFLIPLAMILYPALKYKGVTYLSLFIVLFFILWYIIRLVKIISISVQVPLSKITVSFGLIIVILVMVSSLYYQNFHNTYNFIKFFINVYIQQ